MKAKHLLYCILLILIIFGIRRIPLGFLDQSHALHPYGKNVRMVILSCIAIGVLFWIGKKYRIAQTGGFTHHDLRNYWTLIIPFVFPGLLFFTNFSFSCITDSLRIFVSLLSTIALGIFEEVLFRGVIQGYLIKHSTDKTYTRVIVVTSLLFAFAHFVNFLLRNDSGVFTQVIYSFFMGLLLGALLIKTRNVWLVGVVHGLLNFISGICPTTISPDAQEVELTKAVWFLLGEMIKVALLFSPILIIYWALMKNTVLKKVWEDKDDSLNHKG